MCNTNTTLVCRIRVNTFSGHHMELDLAHCGWSTLAMCLLLLEYYPLSQQYILPKTSYGFNHIFYHGCPLYDSTKSTLSIKKEFSKNKPRQKL